MLTMRKLSLLLLFATFSQGNAAADGCPAGWTEYGLKCVKFFSTQLDWLSAEKYCQNFGGNLASVHSKAENDLLLSLVPGYTRTWIGAHDSAQEGQWLWSDGTPVDFTNWCAGQPDNAGGAENYLEMNFATHCWNDCNRPAQLAFICARTLV